MQKKERKNKRKLEDGIEWNGMHTTDIDNTFIIWMFLKNMMSHFLSRRYCVNYKILTWIYFKSTTLLTDSPSYFIDIINKNVYNLLFHGLMPFLVCIIYSSQWKTHHQFFFLCFCIFVSFFSILLLHDFRRFMCHTVEIYQNLFSCGSFLFVIDDQLHRNVRVRIFPSSFTEEVFFYFSFSGPCGHDMTIWPIR